MKDILNACFNSKVTSLNLGQNSLTEKSLELLEQYDLGEIRNITLSLNKINRRNVKNRLDEFVKRGITLSIWCTHDFQIRIEFQYSKMFRASNKIL